MQNNLLAAQRNNRNILECKVAISFNVFPMFSRNNRNILECKLINPMRECDSNWK